MFQRIEQRLRFEQATAPLCVERNGIRARRDRRLIAPHQQLRTNRACHFIAECKHLGELEAGVDMQQRKRNRAGKKRLLRQAQHHRRVLADGVKHHGPLEFRSHFAQNMNALGLQQAQVAEPLGSALFRTRAGDGWR